MMPFPSRSRRLGLRIPHPADTRDYGDRPRLSPGPTMDHDRRAAGLHSRRQVRVAIMTRGTLLVLGALIGTAVALPRGQGPGDAAAEYPLPPRVGEPGVRDGTWGLDPGSTVYCLAHPDLGIGTVVEKKRAARVAFGSRLLTLDEAELRHADPLQPNGDPAAEILAGSPGGTTSADRFTGDPGFAPFSRVTCPSRPEIGHGLIVKNMQIFNIVYRSLVMIQTDEEIRPSRSGVGLTRKAFSSRLIRRADRGAGTSVLIPPSASSAAATGFIGPQDSLGIDMLQTPRKRPGRLGAW